MLRHRETFGLARMLPANTLSMSFASDQLYGLIDRSLPVVIMGALSGYLPERAIFDFALSLLSEDSSPEEEGLALMSYDADPDPWMRDRLLSELVEKVSIDEWALAFMKLLYAAVLRFSEDIHRFDRADGTMDPPGALETLRADFHYVSVADGLDCLGLPPYDMRSANDVDRLVADMCGEFLGKTAAWLKGFSFADAADVEVLHEVMRAWGRCEA